MSHTPRHGGLIAALIPAYQEENFIHDVVTRSLPFVDKVLVVNDGSTDHTAAIAQTAGAEVISHDRNLGKGRALQTGFKYLLERGCYHIIILDGDLQHLPEEIKFFIREIHKSDSAMTVGCRSTDDGKMPFVRKCTNQFMSSLLSCVCGQKIPDSQCGFRSIRSDVVDLIQSNCSTSGYDFESEMLLIASRHGYRIQSVPITTVYGAEVSKIRPVPDTIRFFKLMFRYLFRRKITQKSRSSHTNPADLKVSSSNVKI